MPNGGESPRRRRALTDLRISLRRSRSNTVGASADGGYLPAAPVPVDAPAEHNALVLGLLQLRPPGGGW